MDEGGLQDARGRFQRAIETRDKAMADGVLHSDYALVLMLPAKAVMPRARWLDVLPDYVVHDYAVEDEAVDVDDDLAVVLHRDRMQATVLGEDRSGIFIITDVWRKGNDGWRVWRRHSTPLAAGRLPGVP